MGMQRKRISRTGGLRRMAKRWTVALPVVVVRRRRRRKMLES